MEMLKQRREVMFEDEEQEEEEYEHDANEGRYEDDISSALDDGHERYVSARPAVGSMSYYTDPSIPLSLFLLDGVLPQRNDDEDHTAGGGVGQQRSSQGHRKSPLEVTLSPPKPVVNASTRYVPSPLTRSLYDIHHITPSLTFTSPYSPLHHPIL